MKDELIFNILPEKPAVIDFVIPVETRRKDQLILIPDPIQRLMIDDPLRQHRGKTDQQEYG